MAAWVAARSQGRVNRMTQVIIFVILFGLLANYPVWRLLRVRELLLPGPATPSDAVTMGSAAPQPESLPLPGLILVATFGSIAASSLETMKEIGVGLAISVLIDATLLRIIMVPATMRTGPEGGLGVAEDLQGGWIDPCPLSSTNRLPRLRRRKPIGQRTDDHVDVTV